MIKIKEVRESIYNHLGHSNFMVTKYTLKHDNRRGYNIVVFQENDNDKVRLGGLVFKDHQLNLIHDRVTPKLLGGKPLGFMTYELI